MSTTNASTGDESNSYRDYVLDVRIREFHPSDADAPRYRFEAPEHAGITFDDPEMATLYADIYFAVNGFVEAETGNRGVPPEIVQAGKDTLAAYLTVQTSVDWVASFYGAEPTRIERYISWVREQAEEMRAQAAQQSTE